jgi:hypothetical protein
MPSKSENQKPTQPRPTQPTNLRRLVEIRLAILGKSKSQLCTEAGFTSATLHKWLSKGDEQMSVTSMRRLAASLQCEVAALLGAPGVVPEELTTPPKS